MQPTFVLSLVAAPLVAAQCNKVQIFTAVGHGETYPGVQRSITTAVCQGISSCGVANILYPSTVSGDGCRAIEQGIANGRAVITDYVTKCPESKIVVMGWSQGASVVGDLLAGGGGPGKGAMAGCIQATTQPMDPTTSPGSHIVAVALYGNPRHNANQKFNVGTGSAIDGVMARPAENLAALQAWGDRLQDYCAMGDVACNAGRDGGAHSSYFTSSYASIPAKYGLSKLSISGSLCEWTVIPDGYNIKAPTLLLNGKKGEAQNVAMQPFFDDSDKVKRATIEGAVHFRDSCRLAGEATGEILPLSRASAEYIFTSSALRGPQESRDSCRLPSWLDLVHFAPPLDLGNQPRHVSSFLVCSYLSVLHISSPNHRHSPQASNMQDHAHLTRLPLEICEKIAAFLPARSLLSLGQTCRYLRIACHHPVVLQGSFMNYLDYPSNPTALLPDKEALRSLIAVQLATATKTDEGGPNDASVWLHLAFAASHLCPPSPSFIEMLDSLSLDDDLSSSPTPSPLSEALVNLVGTLSTFTIFGLPALVRTAAQLQANTTVTAALIGLSVKLSYGTFYRAQDPAHRDVLAAQAALCLATGSLQASAHPVPEGLDINMSILTQRVAHAFGFGRIIDNDPNEMAITAEWCRSLQGGQAIGLLAVASAAHLLLGHRAVQARNDLPRVDEERLLSKKSKSTMTEPGTGTATAVHIPLPQGSIGTGVLWADSIGTALRGYGAAAGPGYAQWLRENVDELIDDLSNGEWVGYYTYGAQTGSRVDAPLQGIHFTVEADPDDGDGVVVEAQGCRDGVGEFALNGKLSRTGGWVALRKTYTQAGFSWVNQGWLTPFGIAGYWGRELDGLGRGFVWMYKKEWTRGGAVN